MNFLHTLLMIEYISVLYKASIAKLRATLYMVANITRISIVHF